MPLVHHVRFSDAPRALACEARLAALLALLPVLLLVVSSRPAGAQAEAPTTISVSGGAQGATQVVPEGEPRFGLRVPLKPNAENLLTLTATDTEGRTATVDGIRVAQISLTEIVRAQVTATRLSAPEIRQLVAEGVINVADPSNYNVSRFVVALVVGGTQLQVSVPVVRRVEEPMGLGEPISIGCAAPGKGLETTDRAISVPCGGGGGGGKVPDIQVIPFEIVLPEVPGAPSIPGVIVIEGRIKTLKEFFKVNLMLLNLSPLFTLTNLTATLELPEGMLSGVAPAGGSIVLDDLAPLAEGNGQFIIRGDEKGVHTVRAHFGGTITGAFLPEPVPFSGSASTDVEVKGPPKMDVKVSHPDYVTAGEPYELRVEIVNTDTELDALYTSLEIDVGGDAELIDEATGETQEGPSIRQVGDILRGERIVQTYRVLPRVTGPITSCVGAATENLSLSVGFTGSSLGCAIGTLPSDRVSPDGKPTVTVVPSHNTTDVPIDPAIVAIFSAEMIEQTITTGYPQASFLVQDAEGTLVGGTLTYTRLFGNTAAIFRPSSPLAPSTEYTITVRPDVFDLDGNSLSSGIVARFTTEGPPAPDAIAPQVTLAVEAPHVAQSVQRGVLLPVVADSSDNERVVRVDLFLDGELIDVKLPRSPVHFVVETGQLEQGASHVLRAVAYDAVGNSAASELTIQIAPDITPPTVAIEAPAAIGRGRALIVEVVASDDTRVAGVELFLDGAADPLASGRVAPFQFPVETEALAGGLHTLRVVAVDGAGNTAEAVGSFEVTFDAASPAVQVVAPAFGTQVRPGAGLAVVALVTDDTAVAGVAFYVDAEAAPRGTDPSGVIVDTTGLADGPHTVRVVATDTSGNVAEAIVAFSIADDADVTPPEAPVAALLGVLPQANGLVLVTGGAGAVEAGVRVVVRNARTSGEYQTVAGETGLFSVDVEAHGGDALAVTAFDVTGNASAATPLVVPVPATLVAIRVEPAAVTLSRATPSQPLVVTGTFSDESEVVLQAGLTFVSSVPGIVSPTADGLLLPGQNGAATVTVSSTVPGVAPVDVPVTVDFTSVTRLIASPSPLQIPGLGRREPIVVQARYSDDTTGAFGGVVHFATSDPNVAIVDGSGVVTSTGVGSAIVTVASGALPVETVLVVVSAVQPTALLVGPNPVELDDIGRTVPLQVQFQFSDGTVGAAPFAVTYGTRDAGVATVSGEGVVTAVAEGDTLLDVQAAGLSAIVSVSVTVPSVFPPPEITLLGRAIAGEGDTLVIVGRNFSGNPAANLVTIGALRAEVIGGSFDRLIARVPVGAASGDVVVRLAGQSSNPVPLAIYPRRAQAVLTSAPFAVPGDDVVDLGSVQVVMQPGDVLMLAGDPNLVVGAQWTALQGPEVTGLAVVTVDGVEGVYATSATPIDLAGLVGAVDEPRTVTVQVRVEPVAGQAASRGLAVVAGPPDTGALVGERFSTGDTIDQRTTLRFRTGAPDGTKYGVTSAQWYRLDGGFHNGSAGGAILGGDVTPNDGRFRTFTVVDGEIVVTYSDADVLAQFGAEPVAVISVVPANAAGSLTQSIPVAEARVRIGAVDSASLVPQEGSTIADGESRLIVVDINSVRDLYGNRLSDGTRLAVTASQWYRRADGGFHNGSRGGTISGGAVTPNDGRFRTVELVGGVAQLTYAATGAPLDAGQTATAVLAAVVANASNSRVLDRPFAEGTVQLSAVSTVIGNVSALPSQLAAASADLRSVVTLSGLTDGAGHPLPDGTRVAVTAQAWYRLADGGFHNGSFGGTILGGDPVPNDGRFRSFVVQDGSVTFTYSNAGLVLDRLETATTVLAILPAQANGNRIGERPFAEAHITQAGLTTATVVTSPSSTVADGARRPVAVTITNIRDALGNLVPDGVRVALTADAWYRRGDGGFHNGSVGGVFIDGEATPNDGRFRTFTVQGGRIEATYSAESVSPLAVTDHRTAVIAVVAASQANNNRAVTVPFAEGALAVSSVATGAIAVAPASLLADTQDRRSVVTITGLVDSQGRPVPDGTKVALTAANWYRLADGGFGNGSAGGAFIDGAPTPNDGRFRTYTVQNGAVTAVYSSAGLFVPTGGLSPAVISVLPATSAGNIVGSRPLAATTVTLAGMDTGTFVAPATAPPGSTVRVTLTNLRDATGALLPDGAVIAVTAANWYNRDGSFGNGSAGGTITSGTASGIHGDFRNHVVSGGEVSLDVVLPATADRTTVLSAVSTVGASSWHVPFTVFAIRTTVP